MGTSPPTGNTSGVPQELLRTDRSGGAVEELIGELGIPYTALVTPEDLLLGP